MTYELRWIPESVRNILDANGISNHNELARALNLGHNTIYKAFNKNWSGKATHTVLAAMAATFDVPMARLVVEPCVAARRAKMQSRQSQSRARPGKAEYGQARQGN